MPCLERIGIKFMASMESRLAELDDDWKLKAACRGKPLNMFYPYSGSVAEQEVVRFCHDACKVREWCLIWALYIPEEYGVWGGMTSDDRKKLRKRPEIKSMLLATAAST